MAESSPSWQRFKAAHPPGSAVSGTVVQVQAYGVFVDLGAPFTALLLVPDLAPLGRGLAFPRDYPKVGETITAFVSHYGDDAAPGGAGKIALTQRRPPAEP